MPAENTLILIQSSETKDFIIHGKAGSIGFLFTMVSLVPGPTGWLGGGPLWMQDTQWTSTNQAKLCFMGRHYIYYIAQQTHLSSIPEEYILQKAVRASTSKMHRNAGHPWKIVSQHSIALSRLGIIVGSQWMLKWINLTRESSQRSTEVITVNYTTIYVYLYAGFPFNWSSEKDTDFKELKYFCKYYVKWCQEFMAIKDRDKREWKFS